MYSHAHTHHSPSFTVLPNKGMTPIGFTSYNRQRVHVFYVLQQTEGTCALCPTTDRGYMCSMSYNRGYMCSMSYNRRRVHACYCINSWNHKIGESICVHVRVAKYQCTLLVHSRVIHDTASTRGNEPVYKYLPITVTESAWIVLIQQLVPTVKLD